ncbi:MAG: hypothetical protein ABIK43_03850, partial [candidate division WOR-3 bacterium]
MRCLLFACVLSVAGCPHRSELRRLVSSAPPQVIIGHYPDYAEIIYGHNRMEPLIRRLRADVEANEQILRKVVWQHIDLKSPL